MYSEYCDLTISAAMTAYFRDIGAHHQAHTNSIQIIRIKPIEASKTNRPNTYFL